jgi:hypothetical protein
MEVLENILRACITVLALLLVVVSVIAYRRVKHKRVLVLTGAFSLFFIKGLVLTLGLIYVKVEHAYLTSYNNILDLLIIVLLASAIIKR